MNEHNNKKLLNFLKEWLHEAEKPEVEEREPWFRTDSGLCINANKFDIYCKAHNLEEYYGVEEIIIKEFSKTSFPFWRSNYFARSEAKMQHLDHSRLSWVKNKISELEKKLAQ